MCRGELLHHEKKLLIRYFQFSRFIAEPRTGQNRRMAFFQHGIDIGRSDHAETQIPPFLLLFPLLIAGLEFLFGEIPEFL